MNMYHEALHAYIHRMKQKMSPVDFSTKFDGLIINDGRLTGVVNDAHILLAFERIVYGFRDVILSFNPNFGTDHVLALAKGGIIHLDQTEYTINTQERDTRQTRLHGH